MPNWKPDSLPRSIEKPQAQAAVQRVSFALQYELNRWRFSICWSVSNNSAIKLLNVKSLWILQHWLINKRNLTILNLKLSYLQTVLCKRKVSHASVNKLMNCGNSPPSLYPNVADKLNCILTSSEMESWLKIRLVLNLLSNIQNFGKSLEYC